MLWPALACGAVVLGCEPLTIAVLRRLAVIDMPEERSSHTVPTPRGGGVPIAAGLVVAALAAPGPAIARLALAAAVTFFGLLGLLDDLRGLRATTRLVLQLAGAAGVGTLLIAEQPPSAGFAVLATAAAALWLTGFVNTFNFMDGINGISGAHALIGGLAYAGLADWRGDGFGVTAGLALAFAAGAFLPWNAGRARVFLGDVGSYSIGSALAVLAARLVLHGVPPEAVAAPVALYLADVAWTLQRRIRNGDRWLEPHRTHIYQRWCDAGMSHQEVALVTSTLTVLLCLLGVFGLLGGGAERLAADAAGAGVLAVYLASPALFTALGGI
jgi:UDP-GlcNAc:undecaprenyl-phosphate/decaprenyl-phosphate GlcNAc-1-phosphate transferase